MPLQSPKEASEHRSRASQPSSATLAVRDNQATSQRLTSLKTKGIHKNDNQTYENYYN